MGSTGNNTIIGGSGVDTINPETVDIVRGGDGADVITITETALNAKADTIQLQQQLLMVLLLTLPIPITLER